MLIEWIDDRYRWWWPYAGLSFFCAMLAGVIYFSWPSSTTFEEADTSAPTFGTIEDLTQYENFRSAYLEANGGETSIASILSIRNSGVMISGDSEVPFFTIKRRPDKSLTTFKMREYDLSFGVDGETIWQRIKADGQAPNYEIKTGAEAQALAEMGEFFDSTMSTLLHNKGNIERLSSSQWSGTDTVKVEFTPKTNQTKVTAHFDIHSMQQLARIEKFSDGRTRKTLYDDYRNVAGMLEPFTIETYMDDVLQSRILVEKCEANVGAILSLFKYPSQLKDTAKKPNVDLNYKLLDQANE